jgi:hypothetical protein
MGILTAKQRANLPRSDFAIPETRQYPIHDETHARDALARVNAFGSPREKELVYKAVHARYPTLRLQQVNPEPKTPRVHPAFRVNRKGGNNGRRAPIIADIVYGRHGRHLKL